MNVTVTMSSFVTYSKPVVELTSYYVLHEDPISDETLKLLSKIFNAAILVICLSGMCTNAMTICTFYRTGLEDSMTISFFFLAICDFGNCTIVCTSIVCDIFNMMFDEGLLVVELAPYIPSFFINSSRMVFGMAAALLKDYMAIQRCLCVALPFQVRRLFTRVRTFVFVGVVFTFTMFWTLLLLSGHTVKSLTIPEYNITFPVIHRIPELEVFLDHQEFIGSVVFSTGFQVITWVCFIVMMMALKKSVRFRKSATNIFAQNSKSDQSLAVSDGAAGKDFAKEKQVLVQVSILTGLFCVTGGLYMVQGICTLIIPGYTFTGEFRNVYMTAYMWAMFAEMLNATGNFLIYLKFNSKFKKSFIYVCKK